MPHELYNWWSFWRCFFLTTVGKWLWQLLNSSVANTMPRRKIERTAAPHARGWDSVAANLPHSPLPLRLREKLLLYSFSLVGPQIIGCSYQCEAVETIALPFGGHLLLKKTVANLELPFDLKLRLHDSVNSPYLLWQGWHWVGGSPANHPLEGHFLAKQSLDYQTSPT